MKVKELIKQLKSWENYEECDLKVEVGSKKIEIQGIYGGLKNLFIHLK